MSVKWDSDLEAALKQALAQKQSASQIADRLNAQFGLSLSRNAVIGKCNRDRIRLTWQSRVDPVHAPRDRKCPQPSAPMPLQIAREAVQDSALAAVDDASPLTEPAPVLRDDGQPHTLLSLPAGACKWPGEGEGKNVQFCGLATDEAPYCPAHHAKSVVRTQKHQHVGWRAQ